MVHLIDKDTLVVEIKRRLKFVEKRLRRNNSYSERGNAAWERDEALDNVYNSLLYFINTIEVKEVDLEDSIKETLAQKYIDYTFRRHNIDQKSREGQLIYYAYMHGINQCLNQLKAQKGKEV